MRPIAIFLTAASVALVSQAAFAQKVSPPHVDMPAAVDTNKIGAGAKESLQSPTDHAAVTPTLADVAAKATAGPVSTTTVLVTNGPVRDTPQTRALYAPLSHGGRSTKPAGN